MNRQARLVRCVEHGRQLFGALITHCDQHLRSGLRTFAIGAFATAGLMLPGEVTAQDWGGPMSPAPFVQPGPIQTVGHAAHHGYSSEKIGGAYCPPELEADLFPKQRVFSEVTSPLHIAAKDRFAGSWMNVEYMFARVNHHGNRTLGEPILDTVTNGIELVDIREQFPILFADGITTGDAFVPNSSSVGWKNMNGIRGSFGIPIDDRSWIEGRVWSLEEQQGSLVTPSIPPTDPFLSDVFGQPVVQFIATTFTTDGAPGTTVALYDQSFQSSYITNVWSAELNHVQDLRIPFDGWKLQSIMGYRHEEYSERLTFGGTFTNVSGVFTDGNVITGPLATPQSNEIDSKVHNFRHALQFGFRSEMKQKWLTLGVEPKVAFGLAQVRSRVNAQNVREPGNPDRGVMDGLGNLLPPEIMDPASVVTSDRHLAFAPSADLNVYAKFDLTHWLKFKVGYNFAWLGNVGVADSQFTLNEISDPNEDPVNGPLLPGTADVRYTESKGHRTISAVTFGAEIIFP